MLLTIIQTMYPGSGDFPWTHDVIRKVEQKYLTPPNTHLPLPLEAQDFQHVVERSIVAGVTVA